MSKRRCASYSVRNKATEDFREFAAVYGAQIRVVEGAGDGGFFLPSAEVGGDVFW